MENHQPGCSLSTIDYPYINHILTIFNSFLYVTWHQTTNHFRLGTSPSGGRAFLRATPQASPAAARQRGGRSAGVAGGAAQPSAAQGGAMAMEGDDLG